MTKSYTLSHVAIQAAFIELREAADFANQHKTPYAVSSICSAVANIIQGAGSYGGSPQSRLMDLAVECGFRPEFYAGTIRVHYEPKPAQEDDGKGPWKSAERVPADPVIRAKKTTRTKA